MRRLQRLKAFIIWYSGRRSLLQQRPPETQHPDSPTIKPPERRSPQKTPAHSLSRLRCGTTNASSHRCTAGRERKLATERRSTAEQSRHSPASTKREKAALEGVYRTNEEPAYAASVVATGSSPRKWQSAEFQHQQASGRTVRQNEQRPECNYSSAAQCRWRRTAFAMSPHAASPEGNRPARLPEGLRKRPALPRCSSPGSARSAVASCPNARVRRQQSPRSYIAKGEK